VIQKFKPARRAAARSGSGRERERRERPRRIRSLWRNDSPVTDLDIFDAILAESNVEDDDDDLYFMVYCFFKDWNYLREYIQER
jgi:hypothetical protein